MNQKVSFVFHWTKGLQRKAEFFCIRYFWRTKRKSTETITERCLSCQNKSVCQKLARSCKKWKSAKIRYTPFLREGLQLLNIPRVTCIFSLYTQAFRGVCVPGIYKWQVWYFIVYHNWAFQNFILYHATESTDQCDMSWGMMGRLTVILSNIWQLSCILTSYIFHAWYKREYPLIGSADLKSHLCFVSVKTAPILYGDRLHCCECQKEFLTSYIYKHFEVPVCDNCRSVLIFDNW